MVVELVVRAQFARAECARAAPSLLCWFACAGVRGLIACGRKDFRVFAEMVALFVESRGALSRKEWRGKKFAGAVPFRHVSGGGCVAREGSVCPLSCVLFESKKHLGRLQRVGLTKAGLNSLSRQGLPTRAAHLTHLLAPREGPGRLH